MLAFAILLLSAVGPYNRQVEHVVVLDKNQVYHVRDDRDGYTYVSKGIAQWIVWHVYRFDIHVWCWRPQKDSDLIMRDGDGWILKYDGGSVRADFVNETWTQYDPETRDKLVFPRDERRPAIILWKQ